MHMRLVAAAAAIAACAQALPAAGPAAAQSVAEFYKNREITMVISAGPGGGYATYTRTLTDHMGKYIPGNPTFVHQHRQGAGGLVAANYLYNVAPRDGSVIAIIHRGAVSTVPLYGAKGVRFEPARFSWIGSLNSTASFCVSWHTSPVKTFADAKKTPLIVGGLGAGSDTDIIPTVFNNLFDTKFQLVSGYAKGTGILLAMERGEVQGRCGWSWSAIKTTRSHWLEEKKINFLIQASLNRHPDFPNLPSVLDVAETEEQKAILEVIFAPQAMGRPYLGPPGIPHDRLEALRAAFDRTAKDPAFLADAARRKVDIQPMTGADIEALITRLYSLPKAVVQASKDAVQRKDKIRIEVKEIPVVEVTSKVSATRRGGRRISFETGKGETHTVKVSGSRTKVSIAGKKTRRKNVKVGMTCTFAYQGDGTEAKSIACE